MDESLNNLIMQKKNYSDRAALVSGISNKRRMRCHRKFQCVVSLKFCRSFVLVLKIRNSNSELFESFILINSMLFCTCYIPPTYHDQPTPQCSLHLLTIQPFFPLQVCMWTPLLPSKQLLIISVIGQLIGELLSAA